MSKADPDPAAVFAALGDPTRLALLSKLSAGAALSIVALSAGTDLTRQAVTKHLHVLERVGLVAPARAGRETRFVLQPGGVAGARAYLDGVAAQWEDALGRLKAFVEGPEPA